MMDERLRRRRRLVRRERGGRVAALLFLGLFVAAAGGLFLWLRSSDVFAVREVTATATQYVDRRDIAKIVARARGASLLALTTGPLEEALEGLPYVREAEIYRLFPHSLEIRIVERRPLARLDLGRQGVWLIAEDGILLEKSADPGLGETGATLGPPLVRAAHVVEALAGKAAPGPVVESLAVISWFQTTRGTREIPPVSLLTVQAGGEVVVELEGGCKILVGLPQDLDQKLTVSAAIIEQYLRDGRALEYVDVRVPERVAVKAE